MKVIAVIPARYSSTRFAGKVLAKETGKFLIQHTYERACLAKLPEKVLIAADDEKVVDAAKTFGEGYVPSKGENVWIILAKPDVQPLIIPRVLTCGEETVWANGEPFPGANWAMYFNYTVTSD